MARKYLVRTAIDWNPTEVGDSIEGVITKKDAIEVESKDGKKKEKRHFFEVDSDNMLRRVWVSDNLKEAWEMSEVGMSLAITFGGPKKTRSNRTVKKFAVQLYREE